MTGYEADGRKARGLRLLYNNDCSFLANYNVTPPLGKEAFVYEAVGRVLGTQVDCVICNMFGFGDAAPLFPCDVAESGRIWLEDFRNGGEWREQVNVQWAIATDPWGEAVTAAHEAGMEFWAGMRFNDIHPRRWRSEFRAAHPEYVLGKACASPLHGAGAYFMGEECKGYNFAIPEVRAHRLRLVEDVCGRYEVDGFEWDFTRHFGHHFPDIAAGAGVLTGYMREARGCLDRIGERRGRRLGFGARVMATPERCRAVAIEIERWVEEGLVDYISPGPGSPTVTEPFFGPFVEMARGRGCRVYACNTEQMDGRWHYPGWGPPPPAVQRAAALNAWRDGVDGVYTYNFPVQIMKDRREDMGLLRELGRPESLAFKDKSYILLAPYNRPHLAAFTYPMPVEFEVTASGNGRAVAFTVGDDLEKTARLGLLDAVTLELTTGEPGDEVVEFRLNGRLLPRDPQLGYRERVGTHAAALRLRYNLTGGGWIRQGENRLEVAVRRRSPRFLDKFTLYELRVDIRYRALPMRATYGR